MPLSRMQLRHRETVADRTMAFHFERPAGFRFKAGQTIDLTLIDPPETDAEGNIRTFSLAGGPQDADLVFATRMRGSAFKRVLASVPLGTWVEVEGPMGSFTLHHNSAKPAVLLTGGIGITPFRSIVRDASARADTPPIWLFYSNHRPEDAAFLDDLHQLAQTTPSFHFVPTMTRMAASARPWQGESGHITREMLDRHLPDRGSAIYYIAGPSGMVSAMRELLEGAGVNEDDIRSEEFSGY